MRFLIRLVILLIILGGIGAAAYYGQKAIAERNKPRYRLAKVDQGDLRISVNATGEVNPVLKVKVGSFVSGPIEKLHVDYNDEVRKGDLLAEIDPRIYDAAVARDTAALLNRKADVLRVKAELQRAKNDEQRTLKLKEQNPDFISQAELDQYRFAREALEAQLQVAEAGVSQAQANLENSEANVGYTKITSPVDGVVVDRRIDPGQTLAAQFQTPELFVIAPQMREKMHIQASVDEADIGLIQQAKETKQPVFFTVDAYPDVIFNEAVIEQIRIAPTVAQNVVTYPVIVSTPNADLKLLPGMTASITFQVTELKDIVKIPNEALRFNPEKTQVRDSDQRFLELMVPEEDNDSAATTSLTPPVDDTVAATKAATRRVIWVQETAEEAAAAARKKLVDDAEKAGKPVPPETAAAGPADPLNPYSGKLKAIEITIGDSDYRFTHVKGGDLKKGDDVVIGVKPPGVP